MNIGRKREIWLFLFKQVKQLFVELKEMSEEGARRAEFSNSIVWKYIHDCLVPTLEPGEMRGGLQHAKRERIEAEAIVHIGNAVIALLPPVDSAERVEEQEGITQDETRSVDEKNRATAALVFRSAFGRLLACSTPGTIALPTTTFVSFALRLLRAHLTTADYDTASLELTDALGLPHVIVEGGVHKPHSLVVGIAQGDDSSETFLWSFITFHLMRMRGPLLDRLKCPELPEPAAHIQHLRAEFLRVKWGRPAPDFGLTIVKKIAPINHGGGAAANEAAFLDGAL